MSRTKRELERRTEEGCDHPGGSVCPECFNDYALQDFARRNLTEDKCDYCGDSSDKPIAAEFDAVLSFISKGIWRAYNRPENCLPYDSSEGGWQIREPHSAWEVFSSLGLDGTGSSELEDDIADAFGDCMFVPRPTLSIADHSVLTYSWEEFCRQIKHTTRFVFFNVRRRRKRSRDLEVIDDPNESIPPHKILQRLGAMVNRFELVSELPTGSTLIRARQHTRKEQLKTGDVLGSPPEALAGQSRMSPAGISMFYGAVDCQTCFLETFDPKQRRLGFMTFGRFKTLRKLRVLDLTRIPSVPSIFDEARFDCRDPLIFLHDLEEDISKPIKRDGREHYEYVPTQVVSEYFRRIFRYQRRALDGIAFRSSRTGGRTCVCLFASSVECQPASGRRQMLAIDTFETRQIDFDKDSVVNDYPYLPTSSPLIPLQRELFIR